MENEKNVTNGFFNELENTRPFLKMAFQGFPKSGKTYTASLIAIGLHKQIKSKKPIVFYDTERALKALKPLFDKNKIKVLTKETRTLADLVKTIQLCESGTSDILVIDSITHVWEKFVESYKEQKKRDRLQFQDWGILKPKWKKEFSDNLVQSKLHIIFTGRAGYEYDYLENEDGKKELHKSGVKMKAETETAYEPDVLVYMERFEDLIGKNKEVWRSAFVLERTNTIDSKTFKNPTFKDFKPCIDVLLNGCVNDNKEEETKDVFTQYDDKSTQRKIYLETIESCITYVFPGVSKEEKKVKIEVLNKVFSTTSWKQVEISDLKFLEQGSEILKEFNIEYIKSQKAKALEGLELNYEDTLKILDDCIINSRVIKPEDIFGEMK